MRQPTGGSFISGLSLSMRPDHRRAITQGTIPILIESEYFKPSIVYTVLITFDYLFGLIDLTRLSNKSFKMINSNHHKVKHALLQENLF